jgi:predicted NACHT family NTPase
MKKMNNYIFPKIKISGEFKQVIENSFFNRDSYLLKDVKEIFLNNRICVVGEPGYGKSRLLEEIFKTANGEKKGCFLINLKKLSNDTIDEHINKIKETCLIYNDSLVLKDCEVIKTSNFILQDNENTIICLDALDEVTTNNFNKVIDRIEQFAGQYPNITLIVSCRSVFLREKSSIFEKNMFKFLNIEPFSNDDITEFLKNNGIKVEVIEELIKMLGSGNEFCLRVPRYLVMITELLNNNEDISKIKRIDLFEKFIYSKLEIEDKNLDSSDVDITKRILEQLALVMQIYQTKSITKDELMTFFNDIDSGLKDYFLQHIRLNNLYQRSLLKDNKETVEFENVEFQEYLAAKEISRLGNMEHVVFDLSVNSNLREVYTSCYNTIRFLIEIDSTILNNFIQF